MYLEIAIFLVGAHIDVQQVGMQVERVALVVQMRRDEGKPQVKRRRSRLTQRLRQPNDPLDVTAFRLLCNFGCMPKQMTRRTLIEFKLYLPAIIYDVCMHFSCQLDTFAYISASLQHLPLVICNQNGS